MRSAKRCFVAYWVASEIGRVTVDGWRHNDQEARWELGYDDVPRQEFVVVAEVTDELIERTGPRMTARYLNDRIGSVPPPLREYLPAPAGVVFAEEQP